MISPERSDLSSSFLYLFAGKLLDVTPGCVVVLGCCQPDLVNILSLVLFVLITDVCIVHHSSLLFQNAH